MKYKKINYYQLVILIGLTIVFEFDRGYIFVLLIIVIRKLKLMFLRFLSIID